MVGLDGMTTLEWKYDETVGSISSTHSVVPLGVRRTPPDMTIGQQIIGEWGIT